MEVIGVGHSVSQGMKKGVVTDVGKLSAAIKEALQEAEDMAQCRVHSVFVGVSGDHIRSITSRGMTSCGGSEIDEAIKLNAIKCAQEHELPGDYQLLHAVPQHFSLDQTPGIKEPVGMFGTRLEAHLLLITCADNALKNLKNCLRRCHVQGAAYILEHIASSEAVLSEDEKELGVCLIDIGGGTTDIAVFLDGSLSAIGVIPIGGDQATNDVTRGLRVPFSEAESLKLKHGAVMLDAERAAEKIEISGLGGRAPNHISAKQLVEVIRPRYEELFDLVAKKLEEMQCDMKEMVSGVVLTGGSSLVGGAAELAESMFKVPARVGVPTNIRGTVDTLRQPNFSTTVGLLRYGYKHQQAKLSENVWARFRLALQNIKFPWSDRL